MLESPAWYTAYTPYQAEISQGRLEALVNFQTMVTRPDRHGDRQRVDARRGDRRRRGDDARASAASRAPSDTIVVAGDAHPQTIEVMRTRAAAARPQVVLANSAEEWDRLIEGGDYFAVLRAVAGDERRSCTTCAPMRRRIHAHGAAFIVAADLLALTLIAPPGELGADIACGTTQRFGMPMGCGGPHAAYLACRDEYKRGLPGRLVGVSVDAHGRAGLSPRAADARAAHPAREARPRTSARRRCCRRSSPACTRSTTARTG